MLIMGHKYNKIFMLARSDQYYPAKCNKTADSDLTGVALY